MLIKKRHPFVYVLLWIVVTAFLLISCVSKPTDEKTTDENTEEPQPSGETPEDSTPQSEIQPIVEKPITLTYYISKGIGDVNDYNEMACWKVMEEKTGIKIEWMHPPAGDRGEFLAGMFASQDLPDLIYISWDGQDVMKLLNEGSIIKLNDLIDQYAPTYKKWMEQYPTWEKGVTLEDGTHYKFAYITPVGPGYYNNGFIVRKDWLDKLGLKVPTTIDEWYTVLKAFKEQDPNGNGKADEIPFCDVNGARLSYFIGAWGIASRFYEENRKVQFGPIRPEYKDYLTTMRRWVTEGLVDLDEDRGGVDEFDQKMQQNIIGSWKADGVGGWLGKYIEMMRPILPTFEAVATPFPKLSADSAVGFTHVRPDEYGGSPKGYGTAITGKNKYPVESAKWLDYHYTEEGRRLFLYGIENESYILVNGDPQYTEKILKGEEPIGKYCMVQSHISTIGDSMTIIKRAAHPEQRAALELWYEQGKNANYPAMGLPGLKFTAEEDAKIREIMDPIITYINDMTGKFIRGEEPIEHFDDFVKTIKDMRIDEAIAIYQAALDRYYEEMEALLKK